MSILNSVPENKKLYVIERNIPGAGDLTPEQLKGISQTSCNVLNELGSEIQWKHSFVTGDNIYCIYTAPIKRKYMNLPKKVVFLQTLLVK